MKGIYSITNTINGKRYIGKSGRDIEERWRIHSGELTRGAHCNSYLQRAWTKYGATCFRLDVLEEVDDLSQLDQRERDLIAAYDTTNRAKGYNISLGGDGAGHSEETRRKMSASHMGLPSPNKGKTLSPEWRAKVGEATKRRPGPNKGKTLSPEWRANIKAAWARRKALGESHNV